MVAEACVNEGNLFWLGILDSYVSFVSLPAARVLGLVHAWTPGSEAVGVSYCTQGQGFSKRLSMKVRMAGQVSPSRYWRCHSRSLQSGP